MQSLSLAPAPQQPGLSAEQRRIAELEHENEKLRRINKVLMDRVERSMDFQGNAFSLFQTAIVLETKVRERTLELESTLRELESSNRDLGRAKELAETVQTRLIEAIESVNEGFALFDAEDRLVLLQSEELLDEDEDHRRTEQIEDEPVDPQVRCVIREVGNGDGGASEEFGDDQDGERGERQPPYAPEDHVEQTDRAGGDRVRRDGRAPGAPARRRRRPARRRRGGAGLGP